MFPFSRRARDGSRDEAEAEADCDCPSLSLNRLESRSVRILNEACILSLSVSLSKMRGIHVTLCAPLRREALRQISALTLNDG